MASVDGLSSSSSPASRPELVCGICKSSPCDSNGSYLLLEAMQCVAGDDVKIKKEYCLGGCGSGVVVKPRGGRRKTLPAIVDEFTAFEAAESLLKEMEGGLDKTKLEDAKRKMEAGERVLEKVEDPEICQNCGVGLQLYRGNCAKCGKYPY